MDGKEINEMQRFENRGKEDEEKGLVQLRIKTMVTGLAFHTIEATHIDPETGWVPFPCNVFADIVVEAWLILGSDETRSQKFIDIGCGIGTKVLLAQSLFDACGFDIVSEHLDIARMLGCRNVFQDDARTYRDYAQYDFIFFYAPFFGDSELERTFEETVHYLMKPGAIIAPMHSVMEWDKLPWMKPVGRYLLRKEV